MWTQNGRTTTTKSHTEQSSEFIKKKNRTTTTALRFNNINNNNNKRFDRMHQKNNNSTEVEIDIHFFFMCCANCERILPRAMLNQTLSVYTSNNIVTRKIVWLWRGIRECIRRLIITLYDFDVVFNAVVCVFVWPRNLYLKNHFFLFLLLCVHDAFYFEKIQILTVCCNQKQHKRLFSERVKKISTDDMLFSFLRNAHLLNYDRLRLIFVTCTRHTVTVLCSQLRVSFHPVYYSFSCLQLKF